MNVAFDPQIFTLQRHGGVSRYFVELCRAMSDIEGINSRIFAPIHFNAYLRELPGAKGLYLPWSSDLLGFNNHVRQTSYAIAKNMLSRFSPTILHETFYGEGLPWFKRYVTFTTIHDLTRERLNIDKRKIKRKAQAIKRADAIISVSKNTALDLFEFYDVPKHKVRTIYVGVSDYFRIKTEATLSLFSSNKPFLLYVGHRDGYKNWRLLINAYSESRYLLDNFSLYCFGGNEFNFSEMQWIANLGLSDKVKHFQGDDSLLRSMYQNASCLIYPSLYEGFGSPIIEAMASGCPVFTSRTSALVESGGNAAEFFEPSSLESVRSTLEEGLSSSTKLQKMILHGFEHSSKFTWANTAIETTKFYREIAS